HHAALHHLGLGRRGPRLDGPHRLVPLGGRRGPGAHRPRPDLSGPRMGRTKVGVVQMTSTPDVERNLATVERLVTEAAGEGAALVLVPECFAYLGPEEGKLAIAEPLPVGGPILARCQALARGCGVELVLGGFWERGDAILKKLIK